MPNRWIGNAFIYLIIFVAVIAIFFTLFSSGDNGQETDLTTILDQAENGQITKIVVDGDRLIATPRQNPNNLLIATKEPGASIFDILQAAEINPVQEGILVERSREPFRDPHPVPAAHLLRRNSVVHDAPSPGQQ